MYFKTIRTLQDYVETLTFSESESLLVVVGDKSESDIQGMMSYLNEKKINFFGGVFSGLLVGSKLKREGFIAQKLTPVYSSIVFPNMMRLKENPSSFEGMTALVMVDGLSSEMKELTDTVFSKLGKNVKYLGGGAGFYSLSHKPCIFNNKGIYKDAALVCIVNANTQISVEHGWKKLRGPYTVTHSKENLLCELDDCNAFEIYKQVIEDEEHLILSKEDFFSFAKDHPFGIVEETGRIIVRDPIALNVNGDIVCVAGIPEKSEVYILKGDANLLLASSLSIAESSSSNAPEFYRPLLFNCISRAMFLEERFVEELYNIQNKLKFAVEGCLSIGEIASTRRGDLVIHNKSTVIGLLEA
jgi:hypothetical protein